MAKKEWVVEVEEVMVDMEVVEAMEVEVEVVEKVDYITIMKQE